MATVDMTQGSYKKQIIMFAIPVFLSNLFQQLYNIADSLIVGNFLGKNALGAVSSSGSLIFLITSFFTGLASGAGVVVSRLFGEKKYDDMRRSIHTTIAFGICASIFLTIFGVIMTPYILRWMNTAPEVLPNSIEYFRIYFYGVTGVVMYNIFSGTLQAVGNSRRPLVYLIISSVLNVILDLVLIGGFKMGVGAAGLATGISQITSAILCLIYLMKKDSVYRVNLKEIRFHSDMFKEMLHYGIPAGIQNSVIGFANVMVQSNINTFGEDAMAGCGTYFKLEGFAFLPVTCFTLALTTFVGQNLGAKEYERAKVGSRFGIICSVVLSMGTGVIMYFTMPYLARMFSDDAAVLDYAVRQAHTECLFYPLLAFSHCIASVLRGAGKAIIPMAIMLSVWCVLRVTYITIAMAINHYIHLIFIAYPMTWFISSVIYLFMYIFNDWVHGFEHKNKALA